MNERKLIFGLFLVLLFGGCVLQKPVSESLIFETNGVKPRSMIVRAAANAPILSRALYDFARKKYSSNGSDAGLMYAYGPSFAIGNDLSRNIRAGVSTGIFFVGADLSARIFEDVFITIIGNTNGDREVILQRPIVKHPTGGLSLGGFVRSERYAWGYGCSGYDQGYCFGLLPDEWFRVTAYGIRGLWARDVLKMRMEGFFRGWLFDYAPFTSTYTRSECRSATGFVEQKTPVTLY